MHVLGLGELVCFVSSDAVAYFVFGWRDREDEASDMSAPSLVLFSSFLLPRAVLLDLPLAGLILSNPSEHAYNACGYETHPHSPLLFLVHACPRWDDLSFWD